MAFDINTAKLIEDGFDLSTAKPVSPIASVIKQFVNAPTQALTQAVQPSTQVEQSANVLGGDPLGIPSAAVGQASQVPQHILDLVLPTAGGFGGAKGGLPGISAGVGAGSGLSQAIRRARTDTGEPLTVDGFSRSAKEVLGEAAKSAAATFLFGSTMQLAGKGVGALVGKKGLLTASHGRQHRLFQLQKDRMLKGFRQKSQQLNQQKSQSINIARKRTSELIQSSSAQTQKNISSLTAEQDSLNQAMNKMAEQSVLRVRDAFPEVAKKTSEQYRALVDDSLKGLETHQVPFVDLISTLKNKFSNDPELFGIALKKLGLSEDLAAIIIQSGGRSIEGLGRGQSMTVKNVVQRMTKLRQGIKAGARGSKQAYSLEDKILDDTSDALLEVLGKNGVGGLEKASAFWGQWAPIRNQVFRDFRPFLKTETETAQGINRLIRVAKGKDPGNQKFIEGLEGRLGLPLTENLRTTLQRMNVIQKQKLSAKLNNELNIGKIKTISQKAVDDAKETFVKASETINLSQQTATSQLERTQFQSKQALELKRNIARRGVHVGSVVVLYQLLRRSIDAVLPKFDTGGPN